MSSLIHVLDEQTINKIAAGEVVERPASVIKELVENAIDAGATKIEVEVMAGGTSFMRVTDNGRGMSKEDAQLAVLRHATSKLYQVSDLSSLVTLGFRGEALATIASVSKFSLTTRLVDDEFATLVEIQGGTIIDTREAGGNIGTTIKVEDLFYNTPARKKFLKTPNSEGTHINDILIKLAISNPNILFKFINNNKLVLTTPGNGNLFDTLQSIYGVKVGNELLGVHFQDEGIGISGYLSKPAILRSSRQWQTYIVNGRVISSRSIAKAIDNAYHSMLPKNGFPLAVLTINVPQHTIDVNVHPQKTEMKFSDEGRIFKAVYKAVLDAIKMPENLETVASTVQNIERHYTSVPISFPHNDLKLAQNQTYNNSLRRELELKDPNADFSTAQKMLSTEKNREFRTRENVQENKVESYIAEETSNYTEPLQPMGQVADCYIIASAGKDLYIVDQHAAHERILYDRFAQMAEEIPSQQLLVHLFLDFDDKEYQIILDNQALFSKLGFSMEPSGPSAMRLTEVPADIPIGEAEAIIREILGEVQEMRNPSAKEIRHACIAVTACRAAIKAGDLLNIRQMQIILDELANTTLPYTCPHGRPVIIKFQNDELAKMFKRT